MANYIVRDDKIFITNSKALTEEERAEVMLYKDLGYKPIISRKKPNKPKKPGNSKLEIIYYLECEAPDKLVKDYIKLCDTDNKAGGGFLNANNKIFYPWFEANKAELDENGKKKKYNGEAANLIEKNGEAAKKRIKELQAEDDEKKKKKAEEKKKNK